MYTLSKEFINILFADVINTSVIVTDQSDQIITPTPTIQPSDGNVNFILHVYWYLAEVQYNTVIFLLL